MWNETDEFNYTQWVFYTLSACAILYLLVRHLLLERGSLQPDASQCGDCSKALCISIRRLCSEPSSAQRPAKSRNEGSRTHKNVIVHCTVGALVFYLLFCCNALVLNMSQAAIGWLPFGYCRLGKTVAAILYAIAKCNLYAVFVARLQVGLRGSVYAYSTVVIYGLYAFICVSGVTYMALSVAFYRGQRESVKHAKNTVHFCGTKAPVFYFPLAAFIDLVFTFAVVYLFIAALKQMFADFTKGLDEMSRSKHRKMKADLYLLPLKYSVISTVAIVSTMCALIGYGFGGAYFLLPMDCVINCVSLLLMTKKWKAIYEVLCTPLLRCVVRSPCLPCAELTDMDLIEIVQKRNSDVLRATQ